jgi:predicted metalloendopeptidase
MTPRFPAWTRLLPLGTSLLLGAAGCATAPAAAPSAPSAAAAEASPAAPAAPAPAAPTGTLGVDTGNFDTSVRPQDDFYRYANGTWLRTTQIPADRGSYGSFIELRDKSEAALRALVEEAAGAPAGTHPEGSDLQKVADLYRSFMDTARVEAAGLAPLKGELARVAGLQRREQLPELLAELQRQGVQTPFGASVGQDAKNATRYVLSVSQSGLGLPDRDYYFKPEPRFVEMRAAYLAYVQTLLALAGEKDPAGGAKAVVAFETELAKAHWDRARSRDREATYNFRSVADLAKLTPGFSWERYLKAANASATPGVVVRQPDVLEATFARVARTPVPVLRQYLTVKLVDAAAPFLSSPFEQAHFEFRGRVLQGQPENRPRWKRAVAAEEAALGEVLGKLYVERHFKPEAKARMEKLVANLREAFKEGIDGLSWMGPETRAQAQAKLARFNVKIGYPEKWKDYSALQVRADDLVGNLRRSAAVEHARMMAKLGKPIDRLEWGMTPQTVNAYYSSTMNEIVFPAAILQPPFFDPEADDATNYGAIGGVIGHEISHGFDDQGSRSDGEGNLRDWWTAQDKAAFQERTGRLSAQYDAFAPLEGMRVNGKLTLGENIGDLSGLTVAYRAWQRSLEGKPAPAIGGFSGEQRFFLGWAQIWRSQYRDDALRSQLLTDPHSPGQYRVNGVVRNMPEFHQAFGVKEGDGAYLAPEQRVSIW